MFPICQTHNESQDTYKNCQILYTSLPLDKNKAKKRDTNINLCTNYYF